jgi:hypothetical protein
MIVDLKAAAEKCQATAAECLRIVLQATPDENLVHLLEEAREHPEDTDVEQLFQAAFTALWLKAIREEAARRAVR